MSQIIALSLVIISVVGLGVLLTRTTKRGTILAFIGTLVVLGISITIGQIAFDVPWDRMISSIAGFLIVGASYAVLSLALNVQWGYTGLFNIGVAGFFGVGAYISTILVQIPTNVVGGTATFFSQPFLVGLIAAMIGSGIIAIIVGFATLRLRADYLAIATIGVAEILRLIVSNERELTIGTRGIENIPQPLYECLVKPVGTNTHECVLFDFNIGPLQGIHIPPFELFGIQFPQILEPAQYSWFYLILIIGILALMYFALERISRSPWGRTLRAIREDEDASQALGKNTFAFKMQALVVGAVIMGAAGALVAHFVKFVSPDIFIPIQRTFLVWVMLIVGGTGNNRGAIFGAFLMWAIWTSTQSLNDILPTTINAPLIGEIDVAAQLFGPLRIMAIVIVLEAILLYRPRGLMPEEKHTSTMKSQ